MIKAAGVPKIVYFKDPIKVNIDGKTYTAHHVKTETFVQIIKMVRKSTCDNFTKILSLLFAADERDFEKIAKKRYLSIFCSVLIPLGQNMDFKTSSLIGGLGDPLKE